MFIITTLARMVVTPAMPVAVPFLTDTIVLTMLLPLLLAMAVLSDKEPVIQEATITDSVLQVVEVVIMVVAITCRTVIHIVLPICNITVEAVVI